MMPIWLMKSESIWSMTIRNFSGLFQEMAEYFLRMTYMTMLWKRIKATHRGSLNPLQTPRNLTSSLSQTSQLLMQSHQEKLLTLQKRPSPAASRIGCPTAIEFRLLKIMHIKFKIYQLALKLLNSLIQ